MRASDRQFGRVSVRLVQGDIATVCADVLVNAANTQLHMGGGVAAALRSRGGIEIHQEAIRHAPAALGTVVRTHAGRLSARFVYHAVVIDYDVSKGTSASDVATAMKNILAQAATDEVKSLALPLFGAGVGGLSVETSLETILDGIEQKNLDLARPLQITIAVRDREDFGRARDSFWGYTNREARAQEESNLASDFLKELLKKRRD
ncbi:MAG TPA: macro domain-containing protein [Vicinamibacteria bacterium]|nr:macro domain-containing protein [Vicinamibacteria bacterium]